MTVLFDVVSVEGALDTLLAYRYPDVNLSPILRIQNAAARASRTKELNAALRDVDETYSAVARLERRLKELSLRLHLRRSALSAAMAPVTALPTELLREIFLHVAESDKTSKARIALSHVSSTWREASLGLQELWTTIQVPYRHPEMFHEFARRSGDLRIELSTLSRWPDDLELDRPEASRLAAAVFTSDTALQLLSSLEKSEHLVHLDKFVASAKCLGIGGISLYMLDCKTIELTGPYIPYYYTARPLRRLSSLTLKSTAVIEVNDLFRHLDAPNLREVTFEDMDIGYTLEPDSGEEEDSDSDAEGDGPVIDLAGFESRITALSIIWCRQKVLWQMCDNLAAPSLVSLSIFFGTDRVDKVTLTKLSLLLSTCPQLEYLDLSVGHIWLHGLGTLWEGGLVPKLHTFRMCNLLDVKGTFYQDPGAAHLLEVMASRAAVSGLEPLRRLVISRSFIREVDEAKLRGVVGELVFLTPPDH